MGKILESLSLSFSLWSGWHFCLDDFNKLLHTKLNKVRVRCCWGNFANYNYSIPGPKGKFALHSKRDSGNGTGFISGSNSGYGLVSGRIKRFTSFRPRRKVRSKEAGKMAAPVKQREREKREVGHGEADRSKHWANFNYSLKLSIKNFAAREKKENSLCVCVGGKIVKTEVPGKMHFEPLELRKLPTR